MRSIFILIFFSLFSPSVFSQAKDEIVRSLDRLTTHPNSIYLFCRGTKSKARLIARDFNIRDTNITHVGLGYSEDGSFRIFNVTDIKGYSDALLVDSVASFIALEDVYYFSVWEYKSNMRDIKKMKKLLKSFMERKIVFDISFRLNKDDTLYCSEFCAIVLNSIDVYAYHFEPVKKRLKDRLYAAVLKREELIYYPVDFFQEDKHFHKLCEFRIEKPY